LDPALFRCRKEDSEVRIKSVAKHRQLPSLTAGDVSRLLTAHDKMTRLIQSLGLADMKPKPPQKPRLVAG
jgi:hypothetical protein